MVAQVSSGTRLHKRPTLAVCRPLSESYRSAGKVMDSSDFGEQDGVVAEVGSDSRSRSAPVATKTSAPPLIHRNTLVLARSMISSPRPLSTALIMKRPNPIIWSILIDGGRASSWRFTDTSSKAGPS